MINLPKRTREANAEGELAHSCVKSVSLYHSNPIRHDLFSRSPGPGGGLRGPNAKNQVYHQPIEMKHCLSQYSSKACLMQNLSLVDFLFF